MLNKKTFIGLLTIVFGLVSYTASATVYAAKKVVMTTGTAESGANINFVYLGETSDGHQIWSGNNTSNGSCRYTYWTIDDGDKISKSTSKFELNKQVTLTTSYNSYLNWSNRDIETDPKYYHFVRIVNKTEAVHFCWNMSSTPSFINDYYLAGASVDATAGDYELLGNEKCYKQQISWSMRGITEDCYSYSNIEYSTDGGKTWQMAASVDSIEGSTTVKIPWTAEKVRYRVTAYPKPYYKVVVKDGCWVYTDSVDCELKPTGIFSRIIADDIKSGYYEGQKSTQRFYQPTITLYASDNLLAALSSSKILYSIDGGDVWLPSDKVDIGNGSFKISVYAGYSKYQFRVLSNSVSEFSHIDEFNPVATSDLYTVTYSPSVDLIYLNGSIDENRDDVAKTFSPTIGYVFNDDLYQTCYGNAVISLSTDGGATWTEISSFAVKSPEGTQKVTIPADMAQYKFRISATSTIDWNSTKQTESTLSNDSPNYHYSIPTGVDDATIDSADDAPVDVFTLSGKLVAKQIRPSEVKHTLESGTYVVGSKMMVVK